MTTSLNFTDKRFYNANDEVQRKYEMLRVHEIDELKIKEAANQFGYSVSMYKKVKKTFEKEGMKGLMKKKPGPQSRHKAQGEVVNLIIQNRENGMNIVDNAKILKSKGYNIGQATVYRVLKEQGYQKKTRTK
jgi:transposase